MTQLEHLLFTIVAIIVMSHRTLCVRHETFWGEKGRNLFMPPLFVLSLSIPIYLNYYNLLKYQRYRMMSVI